jgi:hypothetical protein
MAEVNGTIAQVTHQNNTDHYVVIQMSGADCGSFWRWYFSDFGARARATAGN